MRCIPEMHGASRSAGQDAVNYDYIVGGTPGFYQVGNFAGALFYVDAQFPEAFAYEYSGTVVGTIAVTTGNNEYDGMLSGLRLSWHLLGFASLDSQGGCLDSAPETYSRSITTLRK